MALLSANLVWVLRHELIKIAPIISVYIIFTFPWPVLYISLNFFFFVYSVTLLRKDREKSHSLLPSKRRYNHGLNRNFNSNFSIISSFNIVYAVTNPSSMALNAIRIIIKWWAPTAQCSHKQHQRAPPSWSWFKLILYIIFPLLLFFNTNPVYSAPITYSLPGNNHVIIQEASLDPLWQCNIVWTVIKNTTRPLP